MADGIHAEVSGISETVAAFDAVANFDVEKAENEAGQAILEDVKSRTRSSTGRLAGGYEVKDGKFINEVEYAGFQEFGTQWIEPTRAISAAWESSKDKVEGIFEKGIEDAGRKAGLDAE
jgi:hypothetical protein